MAVIAVLPEGPEQQSALQRQGHGEEAAVRGEAGLGQADDPRDDDGVDLREGGERRWEPSWVQPFLA